MEWQSMELFPAITRATQRFRARTRPPSDKPRPLRHSSSHEERDAHDDDIGEITAWMARLRGHLDEDMALIRGDVEQIHLGIIRDSAQVTTSIDAFTMTLLQRQRREKELVATPADGRRGRKRRERQRRQRQLQVHGVKSGAAVMTTHLRRVRALGIQLNKTMMTTTSETHERKAQQGRAARLATESVGATTIQRAARRFLFTHLYVGGPQQLARAARLRVHAQLRRWLRRWQIFCAHRRRLRRKLWRREARSYVDLAERCRTCAMDVVETDGKYGVAKEFHRLRLVGSVLLAWVHSVTCEDASCCSESSTTQ